MIGLVRVEQTGRRRVDWPGADTSRECIMRALAHTRFTVEVADGIDSFLPPHHADREGVHFGEETK